MGLLPRVVSSSTALSSRLVPATSAPASRRLPAAVLLLLVLPACPAFVSDDYEQVSSDAAGSGGAPGSTDPTGGGGASGPPEATCADGVKNGSETDVDCGTACEAKCALGQGCKSNGDCGSDGKCDKGVCKEK